ncbi:Wall-associated receptor kinase [Thalictrum thalictroides]|uniref:Wall-associated receptor kinase n=1 Tax=Thalictrum thalictroides TaxID=46969 RepID=A0A7J6V5Q6_THATH|nr:Wall-associated receptor kinase [Thalictrum thalictroides]
MFLWLAFEMTGAVNRTETLPGCQPKCGNITVPYPFGIGATCSIAEWFNVKCNNTFNPPKAFIAGNLEVIQFLQSEVRIKNAVSSSCYNQSGTLVDFIRRWIDLTGSPYTFSSTKNKITALGCDTVMITRRADGNTSSGCTSRCHKRELVIDGSCSGIGCCQTSVSRGLNLFNPFLGTINNYIDVWSFDPCGATFLAEKDMYTFKVSDFLNVTSLVDVPMILNFAVRNQTCEAAKMNSTTFACKEKSNCYDSIDGTGYLCNCSDGYAGNPYLNEGCQDVDECENPDNNPCEGLCTNNQGSYSCSCPDDSYGDGKKDGTGCTKRSKTVPVLQLTLGLGFGLLFLLAGGSCLFLTIKKRQLMKRKEKYFRQNGGFLLKQRISSQEGGVDSTKIFTSEELKLATNNYDQHHILGQGGYGTVYKGVLTDLRVVAIKKSKLIDESQLGVFINEFVILTQIKHRNVVKLLGCCLETEVPLLVYEFVSNGTLSYHLHEIRDALMSSFSWEDRLRIAAETAGAVAYLHSAASTPIIHRDIKSANILLDQNNIAKVADFGASRLNPLDETQISTLVQGTMGYLDPEYFHSGLLTGKSDVYSFGVVLAELLTGRKPISFDGSEEQRNLATYFVVAMKENHLSEILEPGIIQEGRTEQVLAVAKLTKRCLKLKGEKRPPMKEVAAELERLRGFEKPSRMQQITEESSSIQYEHGELYPIPSSSYNTDGASGLYSMEQQMISSMNFPR